MPYIDYISNWLAHPTWHEARFSMFPIILAIIIIFLLEANRLRHCLALRNWMMNHPELSATADGQITRVRFWNGRRGPKIRYVTETGLKIDADDIFASHTFFILPFEKGETLDVIYCKTQPLIAYLAKYSLNAEKTAQRIILLSPIILTALILIEIWLIFIV